ncbi:hypothetical protein BGZ58_009184 [Dissophora ornata]|nr:hypothetical protein BGZ58_009184 [Dissophora ornata]
MSVFADTFKTRRPFGDWPHNPTILTQCQTLYGDAVIVGLDERGLKRGITHRHLLMSEFMETHVKNKSMHDGQPVSPFFFPEAKPSGPDIVFYIRNNGSMFLTLVQLKLRQVLSKPDSMRAEESVSDQMVKRHVEELDDSCPADTYISMTIAYPARLTDLLRRTDIDLVAIAARRESLHLRPPESQVGGLQQGDDQGG